jgi:hypothetical protein
MCNIAVYVDELQFFFCKTENMLEQGVAASDHYQLGQTRNPFLGQFLRRKHK